MRLRSYLRLVGYEATLVAEIAGSAPVASYDLHYFSTKPDLLMELAFRHVRARCPSAGRSSKICLRTRFRASKPSSACSQTALRHVARVLAPVAAQIVEREVRRQRARLYGKGYVHSNLPGSRATRC